MGTRAVYTFIDEDDRHSVYKHWDGYPRWACRFIANAVALALDRYGVHRFVGEIAEILFFDSHYELMRASLLGGLVAIRKHGGSGLV